MFVDMWTVGETVGHFFRTNDDVKADAIGYHYFEKPGLPPTLCVIPRYTNDYEDNNSVYAICESEQQTETSSEAVIAPLATLLEEQLQSIN